MKIRSGFVSNSSSSSFICDVSGEIVSGWDMSLHDAEMSECVNGHTFSDEYMVDADDPDEGDEKLSEALEQVYRELDFVKEDAEVVVSRVAANYEVDEDALLKLYYKTEDGEDDDDDDDYESRYEVPAHKCPICTMTEFKDSEMLAYLIGRSGKTREQMEEEIRNETGRNYDKYCEGMTKD